MSSVLEHVEGSETLSAATERVSAEFVESPGLSLSPSQAHRLFGLEPSRGAAVLSALCDRGFLMRDAEGRFRRRFDP
jgi:hypothetical protein